VNIILIYSTIYLKNTFKLPFLINLMKKFAKPLKIMLAMNLNKHASLYQNWYLSLKKLCKKIVKFNTARNSLFYGQDNMNQQFLNMVKKEKPEFLFIYFTYDEVYLESLLKIREISPNTKVVNFFSDDDTQYEDFSRYVALFCNYNIIAQKQFEKSYKEEGIKNTFLIPLIANTDDFKPLNLDKKYDLTFIGAQKQNRVGFIKYLKEKGINVRVFGSSWEKIPELKDVYGGVPSNEEMINIINQTKINLSFTQGRHGIFHLKGRVPEVISCSSFLLTQHFKGHHDYFKEGSEIVSFKTNEELLKKVKYYLKEEKKRESIAKKAYEKMIKKYSMNAKLKEFLEKTSDKKTINKPLPRMNKKFKVLNKKDFEKGFNYINKKIKQADYISFSFDKCIAKPLKNYLQAYSLDKTKKQISCCSYYVYSKNIGNYLFWYFDMLENLNEDEFSSLLDINQLMVTKKYFLKNFKEFQRISSGKKINFVNQSNTAFISLPLIQIRKSKVIDYNILKKSFKMKFLHELYSLYQKKDFSFVNYSTKLLFNALSGKTFIFKALLEASKDKGRIRLAKQLRES